MNRNKNAKSKNKHNFLNRYDNTNKFILKRTKIKCVSLNISILYSCFYSSSTQNFVYCCFVKSLDFVYTKLFSKDFKNHMKSTEGLKLKSTEVFWTLILNHQYDLHTIYYIVARNCHEGYIYLASEEKARA